MKTWNIVMLYLTGEEKATILENKKHQLKAEK